MLITRSFSSQKRANKETSFYKEATTGAMSTMSSAKASKNKPRPATVNSRTWDLVYVFSAILLSIYLYTRSKKRLKSSGLAPSPYFTPFWVGNSILSVVLVGY